MTKDLVNALKDIALSNQLTEVQTNELLAEVDHKIDEVVRKYEINA